MNYGMKAKLLESAPCNLSFMVPYEKTDSLHGRQLIDTKHLQCFKMSSSPSNESEGQVVNHHTVIETTVTSLSKLMAGESPD